MDIPTDLASILSEFGLPAGAVALAYGLVKGADALESDASKDALKHISDLLKKGPLTSVGPLGATVVPFVFDKVFGSRPLSFKFISRSVFASLLFWVVLLLPKHPNWQSIFRSFADHTLFWLFIIPVALFADWISLIKAKVILGFMIRRAKILLAVAFVAIDVLLTYVLIVITWMFFATLTLFVLQVTETGKLDIFGALSVLGWDSVVDSIKNLFGVIDYLTVSQINYLSVVFVPSTLLTSVWVTLFFISTIIVGLLAPLEYLRRFTLWWFKDIDAHPLRAIARVAATLIVVGAFVLKAVRWGWTAV